MCQVRNIVRPGADGGVGSLSGVPTAEPQLGKKFRLTDAELVLQDLLNALSIKQGDKVGQPGYGTTLWGFVFDPNTQELRTQIEDEIRRVAGLDSRISIGTIQLFSHENGILIEMEISINITDQLIPVGFFLNRFDGTIQQV